MSAIEESNLYWNLDDLPRDPRVSCVSLPLNVILSKRSLRSEGSGRAARYRGACPERTQATERARLARLLFDGAIGLQTLLYNKRFGTRF